MRGTATRATLPGMKRLLSMLLAGAALAALTLPAGAVKPEISRYGFSARESVGPDACGFPIVFVVRGKGQTLLFKDRDGNVVRGRATGPIKITFRNRVTDVTATYSISGPSFYDADGELLRGTGRWYVFTVDGEPAIAIGNLAFGPGGVPEDPSKMIDICDDLS